MGRPVPVIRAAALGVLAACVVAPAAGASTARVESEGFRVWFEYDAEPGEENALVMSDSTAPGSGSQAVTFADSGADVTPGPGCTAVSEREVRCDTAAPPLYCECTSVKVPAEIALRDGRDSLFVVGAVPVEARGGDGDDSLAGGAGVDVLEGAAGLDSLLGMDGDDVLRGGEDGDRLDGGLGLDRLDGGPGDDDLAGGEGTDRADYGSRRARLTVDLPAGTVDGADGEHDTLAGIEWIEAGSGNDTIAGDGEDNRLSGGAGRNRIAAGGGDDYVEAGAGDQVAGGGGDDRIVLGNADARDRVTCGEGRDAVGFTDAGDLLEPDCEWAYVAEDPDAFAESGLDVDGLSELLLAVSTRPAVHRRRAVFRVRCLGTRRCRGALTLREAGSRDPLGRRRFRIPARRVRRVTIRLSKSARARLARVEVGAEVLARSSSDAQVYRQDGSFLLELAR